MEKNILNNKRIPAFFLLTPYFIGLVVGFSLVFVATWADMEATFYGFPRQAEFGLSKFSCPILMTRNEIGTISLNLSNTTDVEIRPSIKVMMSSSILPEEQLERVKLAPGESKKLEWQVDAGNIDLGQFIFARVLMYSSYPLPSREALCGIFILDLPISGRITLPLLVAISLFGMSWGLHTMNRAKLGGGEWIAKYLPAMKLLSVVLVLGLIFCFAGAWVASTMTLVVILLMLFILLSSFLMTERRN